MEQGLEGVQSLPEGWDLIDDMRATLQGFEPGTQAEQELYAEGLDRIQRLGTPGGCALWQPSRACPAFCGLF